MANIASLIKTEIMRVARREVRTETEQLKQTSARYRSEIAALKRQNTQLEQRIARLEKHLAQTAGEAQISLTVPTEQRRFRAEGLKKLRERHALSAPTLAAILGISPQTIYNWESRHTKPDSEQLAKIAILRKMGKREVQQRLALMQSS